MQIQLSEQAADALPAVALVAFLAQHGVKVDKYDAATCTLYTIAVSEQSKENDNEQ